MRTGQVQPRAGGTGNRTTTEAGALDHRCLTLMTFLLGKMAGVSARGWMAMSGRERGEEGGAAPHREDRVQPVRQALVATPGATPREGTSLPDPGWWAQVCMSWLRGWDRLQWSCQGCGLNKGGWRTAAGNPPPPPPWVQKKRTIHHTVC